jgi:hypothetical protein
VSKILAGYGYLADEGLARAGYLALGLPRQILHPRAAEAAATATRRAPDAARLWLPAFTTGVSSRFRSRR